MSRAVSGRRSAIRNATSERWRISLSVAWLISRPRQARGSPCRRGRAYRKGLRCSLAALEVLMRRAVVALRQRCPLTRLALAGRRAAPSDAAVERSRLDLLLDEADRRLDALGHGPGDLRLHGDREVAADVLEQGAIRLREVVRVGGQALHRPLTGRQHVPAVLEVGSLVHVRVDQVLDRAVDRSRVLIHAVLNVEDPLVHKPSSDLLEVCRKAVDWRKIVRIARAAEDSTTVPEAVTNVLSFVNRPRASNCCTRASRDYTSAGDLPWVRAAKAGVAGGADAGVRVAARAVDAGEDDEVPGLEARVAARVEDPPPGGAARGGGGWRARGPRG